MANKKLMLLSNTTARLLTLTYRNSPGKAPHRVELAPGLNKLYGEDITTASNVLRKTDYGKALLAKGYISDSDSAVKEAKEVSAQAQDELAAEQKQKLEQANDEAEKAKKAAKEAADKAAASEAENEKLRKEIEEMKAAADTKPDEAPKTKAGTKTAAK